MMRANTYWKCVAEGCKDGKVYNFKGFVGHALPMIKTVM